MSKKEASNTTEAIALDWVRNTVASIDRELGVQLERHGYFKSRFISGELKLDRTVAKSEKDPRFKIETFSVNGRAVMAVRWTPAGFIIEQHSDAVANAIKHNPLWGIKKGVDPSPALIKSASEAEVEIEVIAAQYMEKYKADQAKAQQN